MPDKDMLATLVTDHMAGALPPPLMLFADSLIEINSEARRTHNSLMAAGGTLIDDMAPASLAPDLFDRLLDKLDAMPAEDEGSAVEDNGSDTDLPTALRASLPGPVAGLKWKRIGGGVREYPMVAGVRGYKISLLDIPPGQTIPMHTHRGREYTLVLRGSYTDTYGDMKTGDFICTTEADTHNPVADAATGCLCLAVLDAPLKFKGPLGWLINPFLKV
ncbi:ChrR family anti-sigma-E factor [Gimibacter soli]|uniref:ChrR family anti-sigma-E factor n=1 Tax=Gimibacter soli TaxID=3024400 RepID=A0AAE9XP17_9PROT|nr:ChrR family anti-sigma-E factor [Gimibacter soli]WCL54552.1 ChrR family anti-sigma-E factor [Gimibacter soli]